MSDTEVVTDNVVGEQRDRRKRRPRRDDAADGASGAEGGENGAPDGSAPASGARPPSAPAPAPRKVLYLVRVPKPEKEDVKVTILRTKFDALLSGLKVMNEALRVKRMELADVFDKLRIERDRLDAAIKEYDEKQKVLIPLEIRLKRQREEFKDLRERIKTMEVKSEEELDTKLSELEYQMQHESMPLNEEKKLMQRIKKLEASRLVLREFREKQTAVDLNRTEREELTAVVGDLRQEADILRNERDLAYEGVKKYSRERDILKKSIDAIIKEREELAGKKDAAYEDMRRVMDDQRHKDNDFYRSLKTKSRVKELVEGGQVEEAEGISKDQVSDILGKILSDKEYREEYVRLSESQRGRRVNAADVEEELRAIKVDPKSLPTQMQPIDPDAAVSPRSRAQAIIDRILREANEELGPAPPLDSDAEAAAPPAEEPAPAAAAKEKRAPKEKKAAPKAEEEAAAAPAAPAPAPPKKSVPSGPAASLASVALPVIEGLDFELPASLLQKDEPKLSEAEIKAQRRVAAQKAAEEAAAKKLRQKERATKREQQRAEREKKAAEERQARPKAAGANQFDQLASATEVSSSEADEPGAGHASADEAGKAAAVAAAAAGASSAVSDADVRAPAGKGAVARGGARRRPYKEKKNPVSSSKEAKIVKKTKKLFSDPKFVALAGFTVLLLAILILFLMGGH